MDDPLAELEALAPGLVERLSRVGGVEGVVAAAATEPGGWGRGSMAVRGSSSTEPTLTSSTATSIAWSG